MPNASKSAPAGVGAGDGELPVAVPRFGGGPDRAAEGLALEGHQHRLLALGRRRQRVGAGETLPKYPKVKSNSK